MDMYVNFRGKQPSIDPLLENRGLKWAEQFITHKIKKSVKMKQLIMAAGLALCYCLRYFRKEDRGGWKPVLCGIIPPRLEFHLLIKSVRALQTGLLQGMEEGRKEIEAIVNNPEERRSRIRLSLWMSRVRCFGRSRLFSVDRIAWIRMMRCRR